MKKVSLNVPTQNISIDKNTIDKSRQCLSTENTSCIAQLFGTSKTEDRYADTAYASRKVLSSYQRNGLKILRNKQHMLLFWSMRLRKTVVCIRFIKINRLYPSLISVPFSALYDWKEQLIQNGYTEEDIVIISDKNSREGRKKQLSIDAKIYLMNHDAYRSVPEVGKYQWECMIFDEVHRLMNPRPRMSNFYVRNFRNVTHRIGLTGTWLKNSELDLIQMFRFIDHTTIVPYKDYWQCRHALFEQNRYDWNIKPLGKSFFAKLLHNHASVLEYEDVGVKDRLVEITRYVQLDKYVKKHYDSLLKTFILEDAFVQKSTIFATVNYIWMRQLLSGFIEDRFLNDAKMKELDFLLNTEFKNKKVIIWGYYNEEVKSIAKYLECSFINGSIKPTDREGLKRDFNFGKLDRIVINCRCMKEGANFSPADGEIYLTVPESPIILNQSKRRIFDIDQKQIKLCIYLVTKNTIDETIMEAHKTGQDCKKAIYNQMKKLRIKE